MIEAVDCVIEERKLKKQFSDEKIKSWIHIISKPCLCVHQSYGGNVDEFIQDHPKFIYSKHDCKKKQLHENALKELEKLTK